MQHGLMVLPVFFFCRVISSLSRSALSLSSLCLPLSGTVWGSALFSPLPADAIESAVCGGHGDVMCCCGGFAVDHVALSGHVIKMEPDGEKDVVIGFPIALVRRLLREAEDARGK